MTHTGHTDPWRAGALDQLRHIPPSAGAPRITTIGQHAAALAQVLRAYAPDAALTVCTPVAGLTRARRAWPALAQPARWVRAHTPGLPCAARSCDAVLGQLVLGTAADARAFLADVWRVLRPGGRLIVLERHADAGQGTRPAEWGPLASWAWAWHGRHAQRFNTAEIATQLVQAGYGRVLAEPVLGGLAVLARGERPYAEESSAMRLTQVLANVSLGDTLCVYPEGQAPALPHACYVLVQQRPNQPGWVPRAGPLTWDVLTLQAQATGTPPVLLVFTALTRAVRFMQAVVLAAGGVREFNKVGKFPSRVVRDWSLPLVVDATYEEVQTQLDRYTFPGPALRVDHRLREKYEEEV